MSADSGNVPARSPCALQFWHAPTLDARNAVSALLNACSRLDHEEDGSCADALRVLSLARSLVDHNLMASGALRSKDPRGDVQYVAFDVIALLTAARAYPGQSFGVERRAMLGTALNILNKLTEMLGAGPDGPAQVPALLGAIELSEAEAADGQVQ